MLQSAVIGKTERVNYSAKMRMRVARFVTLAVVWHLPAIGNPFQAKICSRERQIWHNFALISIFGMRGAQPTLGDRII